MTLFTTDNKSAQVGFGYDSVGRLVSLTRTTNGDFATPVTTTFTLDLLDRVTSITHSKGMGEDASTLSQFTYGYDVGGRVTNYTGPEGSLSYALDANGQLLSVTGSRTENYSFDSNGNRTSNSTAAGNLLLNDGKYSYTYDLEGNQKTKTRISDGQVTEFFWDYRNQLTKAMVKDANGILLKELRFTYDVEGRRVGSWVDADGAGPEEPDQVWTVFDGVNPYMDFDGDGLLKTRYLYGPGIDELFARIGSGEDPQWYLADRLGSVRQIVDGAGTILDDIVYDSFGGILSETNPAQGDRFKFTGREFSPELGIYYYRARWYDPSSGRFISQDPIGFSAGDVNLYRYVGNAPGDGVDPEGEKGVSITIDLQDKPAELRNYIFLPWNTIWSGSNASLGDIQKTIESQLKSGDFITQIIFAGHNLDGGTVHIAPNVTVRPETLTDADRNILNENTVLLLKGPAQKEKIKFLLWLKDRMEKNGKIIFAQCNSGIGDEGSALEKNLISFFGNGVKIVLFKGSVIFDWGNPIQIEGIKK
jgi:RHS repeat-associated protein